MSTHLADLPPENPSNVNLSISDCLEFVVVDDSNCQNRFWGIHRYIKDLLCDLQKTVSRSETVTHRFVKYSIKADCPVEQHPHCFPTQGPIYLFNVIVGFEWVLDPQEVVDYETLFTSASNLLYTATQGHIAFGTVLFVGPCFLAAADIQVYNNDRLFPRAGMRENDSERNPSPVRIGNTVLEHCDGPGIIVHEWAHYGFGMRDAYLDGVTGVILLTKPLSGNLMSDVGKSTIDISQIKHTCFLNIADFYGDTAPLGMPFALPEFLTAEFSGAARELLPLGRQYPGLISVIASKYDSKTGGATIDIEVGAVQMHPSNYQILHALQDVERELPPPLEGHIYVPGANTLIPFSEGGAGEGHDGAGGSPGTEAALITAGSLDGDVVLFFAKEENPDVVVITVTNYDEEGKAFYTLRGNAEIKSLNGITPTLHFYFNKDMDGTPYVARLNRERHRNGVWVWDDIASTPAGDFYFAVGLDDSNAHGLLTGNAEESYCLKWES